MARARSGNRAAIVGIDWVLALTPLPASDIVGGMIAACYLPSRAFRGNPFERRQLDSPLPLEKGEGWFFLQ